MINPNETYIVHLGRRRVPVTITRTYLDEGVILAECTCSDDYAVEIIAPLTLIYQENEDMPIWGI